LALRSVAVLLAGLWLGFLAASWVIASGTFRVAERVSSAVAKRPDLETRLSPLSDGDRRVVTRHFAAEVNRFVFQTWAIVQAVAGLALLLVCWRLPAGPRALVAVALAVVVLQGLWLGPAIGTLGRSLDFVPRPLPPEIARRFGLLHGGYLLGDLVKAAALAVTAWRCGR
jgi:hypothetical protein